MRLFSDLLYELAFSAVDEASAATIAIDHAYATFRPEHVAIALLDGAAWSVLPYRENGRVVEPMEIAAADLDDDATYEPGQVVLIPDVALFAERFPRLRPLVELNIVSLVAASFGLRARRRGYLVFAATTDQHYSDDELRLMALYAMATGIGFDRTAPRPA